MDKVTGTIENHSTTGYQRMHIPNDEKILWFDVVASRVVAISDANVLWYSDAQTLSIDGLSYYETEYLNSKPLACWTLANRIAIIADRMMQIWDLSADSDDPLSPAFQGNSYSFRVLPESVCRHQDTLYFIACAVETPQLQIYSLGKSGQLARLSYPQLEKWLNDQIPMDGDKYLFSNVDATYMASATTQWNNMDFIQWKITAASGAFSVLAYNLSFGTFFLSDELTFFAGKRWYGHGSPHCGDLTDYGVDCEYGTKDANFEGRLRAVRAIAIDQDLPFSSRDRQMKVSIERSAPGTAYNSERTVEFPAFSEKQKKNIRSRISGIGSGTNLRTVYKWKGAWEINSISYEVE